MVIVVSIIFDVHFSRKNQIEFGSFILFLYIRFSHQACADTGIPFDTCYTTKALMGLVEELWNDSSQFQARSNFYWIRIKFFLISSMRYMI